MKKFIAATLILWIFILPLESGATVVKSQVGTDISGFSSTDLYGEPIAGNVFSEKKVSVVCYFALWDQNSLNQLAILETIRREHPNYGVFGLLKTDATSTPAAALEYMETMGYRFRVFQCDSVWQSVVSENMFIPQSFIVNKDGLIVEAWQAAFTSPTILEARLAYWNSLYAADGDIDGNGVVTVSDALLALRAAIGLFSPTAEQITHGDINENGTIDAADALLILRMVI